MTDNKQSAEDAFREAADRHAALELHLSEADRARFAVLAKKQEAEREREQRRLEQRQHADEAEQRKQKTALTLDMIQRDRNAPQALRDADAENAREQRRHNDGSMIRSRRME